MTEYVDSIDIDHLEPFRREDRTSAPVPQTTPLLLRVLRINLGLVGLVLFLVLLGLCWMLYSDFDRVTVGSNLRIQQPGRIYEPDTQVMYAVVLVIGALSLVFFRAAASIKLHRRCGRRWGRIAAGLLLAGFPLSGFVWQLVTNLPDSKGDMTTFQLLVHDATWGVRALAVILLLQAMLAVWYLIVLSWGRARRVLTIDNVVSRPFLRRLKHIGFGVGIVAMVVLGITLGVMTDWLYELPVSHPKSGELLYATSFEAFNDEWDLYPGRDAAQVIQSEPLELEGVSGETAPLAGEILLIKYGSGMSGASVWSTLDRKFNDMDLRVTARPVSGPFSEIQYGVFFRLQDANNAYIFYISDDGYYRLDKVVGGFLEILSEWATSDAIFQGEVANEIRIVTQGDAFRFFVNGQPLPLCLKGENRHSMWAAPGDCVAGGELTYVYRDNTFNQGRVALAAGAVYGSEVEVVFDDLVIVGPDPEAAQ